MTETTVGRAATSSDDACPDGSSTSESLDALRDSGELGMLQPASHGGRGMEAEEFVAAIAELSSRAGSAGWLAAMMNAGAHLVDLLGTEAREVVWGASPEALVVAGWQPDGARSGGGSLSGRWLGVTGAEHADWLLLATGAAWLLVPRGEARIERVDTGGLRAAGICDVSVSGVPVPTDRAFDALRDYPAAVGAGAAAAVVGSADGAWHRHVEHVRERLTVSYGVEEVTDQPSAPAQVAWVASDIDAARLQVIASLDTAVAGKSDAGLAHRQAVVRARDATDQLLSTSRRHALDASDPVTRLWRDVHLGCRLTLRLIDGLDRR